jgi:hypothetical protein
MSDLTTLTDTETGRTWDIPTDRLKTWHTLTIYETHWYMAHPITCDLATCGRDAEASSWQSPLDTPLGPGVYRWDDEGIQRIGGVDE